jgi:hypothetical protein
MTTPADRHGRNRTLLADRRLWRVRLLVPGYVVKSTHETERAVAQALVHGAESLPGGPLHGHSAGACTDPPARHLFVTLLRACPADRCSAVQTRARPERREIPAHASHCGPLRKAGATGLEPATSGVTGRRSNRLSYAPVRGTVWHPLSGEDGPSAWDCLGVRSGTWTDMYIGIGTLIIIIILLIILL